MDVLQCVIFSLLFIFFLLPHLLNPQDIANDELVDPSSLSKLLAWHTITDAELAEVFPHAPHPVSLAAKHLLRWCLKGDPLERPTMEEVTAHPVFQGGALELLPPMPMRYRAFISHAQVCFSLLAQITRTLHLQRNYSSSTFFYYFLF